MQVYEAIGQTLEQAGVEHVFGLMGDGNMRFVSSFGVTNGLRFHAARHEATGVMMADGYARATGRVGVATTTEGPGLANTLIAVRAAVMASTPLVVLAGAPPVGAKGHIQEIDQDGVFAVAGAAVMPTPDAAGIIEAVHEALWRAERERRPVGLSIPVDVQLGECDGPAAGTGARAPRDAPPAPDPDALARAAELIAAAERPVVIAGRGAVLAAARAPLVALADALDAPLATSLLGKDLFAGHPRAIGIAGGFSSEPAADLLGEADLVLTFGARLNLWTTRGGTLFSPDVRIIQCDTDPAAIGSLTPANLGLVGDAAEVATRLRELVGAPASGWAGTEFEAIGRHRFEDLSDDEHIDPRALLDALDAMLPLERTLTHDGGHYLGFAAKHVRVPDAAAYLFGAFFGSVGLGIGTALGAAIGRPDRLTVACIGDGGMLMTLGELESAVRLGVPLLLVIVNDRAYGAELHHLDLLGMPTGHSTFGDVDFAGVATAIGARAATVRRTDDLEAIRAWLEQPEGVFLLDCKVTTAVRDRWMEDVAFGHGVQSVR